MNNFPVNAAITPIVEKTSPNTVTNIKSCNRSRFVFRSPEPATYPIIKGNIAKLQGDKDINTPPKNAKNINTNEILPLVASSEK
jgi:hypothetical protein